MVSKSPGSSHEGKLEDMMIIKRVMILLIVLFFTGLIQHSFASEHEAQMAQISHHNMEHSGNDERISLGLSEQMKQHQLSNMRSHLEAVQAITGLIAEGDFNKASEMAHSGLGLTEEMNRMCNMFENKDFTELGLAFHKSGDDLGEVLLTKDTNKSLHALQATVGYCVQCHATFRQ
jgi:hypothetical protein